MFVLYGVVQPCIFLLMRCGQRGAPKKPGENTMNAKTKGYQGHKNYNHWNVSLWINNDERLYNMARSCCINRTRLEGAALMLADLATEGITHTPDGAPYSVSSIRAAMVGL